MPGTSSLVVRGIIGVVLGLIAFAWPGITITALVFLFAAYALLDGISNLFAGATRTAAHDRSSFLAVEGIAGIAAAVITFAWPAITVVALMALIAAWAIVTGVLDVAAAVRLRRVIAGEWLLALSGILSIVFGIFVFAFPLAGALVIAWWLGAYAAAAGVVLIVLGIRLRQHRMIA